MPVLKYDSIDKYTIQKVPEFKSVLEEIQKEKKISATKVIEEFTQFTIQNYIEGKDNIGKRLTFKQAIAVIQEMLLSDDEQIKNLVYLSFLDNLHTAEEYYKFIIPELTPELQEALKESENWKSENIKDD